MASDKSIGVQQAAHASVWSMIDLLFRQGVQFGVSVLMARLLTPADFGLVALLTFFTGLSITFVQGGLATALVQRQDATHAEESAVFWFNLGASIAFAGTLLVIAEPVSRFYGQVLLQPLMAVAGCQIVLSALGAVQGSLLARDLRFAALTKTGLVSSLVSGAAGVAAAWAGWGVWALAVQMLLAAGLGSAGQWWASGWTPQMRFRFASLRRLIGFGSWLGVSSILDVLYTQGFALLLGKLYGVRELGLYNRAASTQLLPANILSLLIARVALPVFAARSNDRDAVRRGIRLANSVAMLLNVPAMIGLSLLSDLVVLVLYGAKWQPAAPILTILALGGILLPLHVVNLQVLLAHGGADRLFRIEIVKKPLAVSCVLLGGFFGVTGLAWSQVAASVISLLLNSGPTRRTLDYGALRQLRDLAGLVLPTCAMAGALIAIRSTVNLPPAMLLILLVGAGGMVYFAVGFALRARIFVDAWAIGVEMVRTYRARDLSTSTGSARS